MGRFARSVYTCAPYDFAHGGSSVIGLAAPIARCCRRHAIVQIQKFLWAFATILHYKYTAGVGGDVWSVNCVGPVHIVGAPRDHGNGVYTVSYEVNTEHHLFASAFQHRNVVRIEVALVNPRCAVAACFFYDYRSVGLSLRVLVDRHVDKCVDSCIHWRIGAPHRLPVQPQCRPSSGGGYTCALPAASKTPMIWCLWCGFSGPDTNGI